MPQFNYPRIFLTPFAANGTRNSIPEEKLNFGAASLSLGFPPETQQPEEAGGIPPDRPDFNGAFHLESSHTVYQAMGGRYRFSAVVAEAAANPGYPAGAVLAHDNPAMPFLLRSLQDNNTDNFNTNPEVIGVSWAIEAQGVHIWNDKTVFRAPCLAFGPSGTLYTCIQDNGPGTAGGVRTPATSPAFWYDAISQYRIGEFKRWFEQSPPAGWRVRNGGLLENVEEDYPELWAFVTNAANNWRVKTMAEWAAQSNDWNGIGGVTFFGLDTVAKQVRLPDTRGHYSEDAGYDGMEVGGVHQDAIRNITGSSSGTWVNASSGAIYRTGGSDSPSGSAGYGYNINFDASRVVPVANKNQPRAHGELPCVFIGGI